MASEELESLMNDTADVQAAHFVGEQLQAAGETVAYQQEVAPTSVLAQTPPVAVMPASHMASAQDVPTDEDEGMIALRNLEARRKKKRRQKWLRIGAGAAVAAALGGWFFLRPMFAPTEERAYVPATAEVVRQDFKTTVQGTGTLQAASTTVITPEVDGIVDAVYVTEGQQVKVGDTICTIKNDSLDKAVSDAAEQLASAQNAAGEAWNAVSELQAAYEKDKASYDDAMAKVAEAEEKAAAAGTAAYNAVAGPYAADLDEKHAALQEAEASVADAITALRDVRTKEGSLDKLYKGDPQNEVYDTDFNLEDSVELRSAKTALSNAYLARDLAQNQYDNAETRFKIADEQGKTAYQQAYASVPIPAAPSFSEASYVSQIESARSAANSASDAVNAASRAYDEAVKQADKRTVKAPKSGTLLSLSAKAGAALGTASSGSGAVAQVSDLSQMKVSIQVNEIDISNIKAGQKAKVTFSALAGLELEAEVTKVASVAAGSEGESYGYGGGGVVSFPVELVIKKPDARLKPGMSASVTIATQDEPNVLVVPSMALTEDGGKTYVSVVTDMETFAAEQREVEVGARSTSDAVITSGLKEGEVILLDGMGVAYGGEGDLGSEDTAASAEFAG